jgi:hypothetical protein
MSRVRRAGEEFDVDVVQLCHDVAMSTGWNVRRRSMRRSHAAAVGRSLVGLGVQVLNYSE